MNVKFTNFETQKRITNSTNKDAIFQVTSHEVDKYDECEAWLILNGRFRVHSSEVVRLVN